MSVVISSMKRFHDNISYLRVMKVAVKVAALRCELREPPNAKFLSFVLLRYLPLSGTRALRISLLWKFFPHYKSIYVWFQWPRFNSARFNSLVIVKPAVFWEKLSAFHINICDSRNLLFPFFLSLYLGIRVIHFYTVRVIAQTSSASFSICNNSHTQLDIF